MTSTRAREESEHEMRPLVASARGRDAGDMARGSAKRRATPLNERPSSSVFERARGALCVVVACAVVGLLFAVTPESTLGRRRWPARAGGARALGVPPGARDDGEPRVFAYDVVASYAHDSNAFTQGLAMCGTGVLCESTGAVGGMKSAVRATEPRSATAGRTVIAGAKAEHEATRHARAATVFICVESCAERHQPQSQKIGGGPAF